MIVIPVMCKEIIINIYVTFTRITFLHAVPPLPLYIIHYMLKEMLLKFWIYSILIKLSFRLRM